MMPQFRGCCDPLDPPPLGTHISISAETLPESPHDGTLRLLHMWVQAATPRTVFECSRLTLQP
jgi:hypothetical protein